MRNLKKYFYLFLQHKKNYIFFIFVYFQTLYSYLNSRSESFNVSIKLKD